MFNRSRKSTRSAQILENGWRRMRDRQAGCSMDKSVVQAMPAWLPLGISKAFANATHFLGPTGNRQACRH